MNDDMSEHDLSMPIEEEGELSHGSDEENSGDAVERDGSVSPRGRKRRKGVKVSPKVVVQTGRKHSNVWQNFKEVKVPSKTEKNVSIIKAKCLYCYKIYSYTPGGATSHLKRHMEKCAPFLNKVAKRMAQAHLNYASDKAGDYEIGVTTTFSASTYPTANVFYPHIVNVKIAFMHATTSSNANLKSMATAMLQKFNKYWEETSNVMVLATILNPSYKMKFVNWCFRQMYESPKAESEYANIEIELERLYEKYERGHRHMKAAARKGVVCSSSSMDASISLPSVSSQFQSFLRESSSEPSKSELLIYLDEKNESLSNKNFNVLEWWKLNTHRFPVVSQMAKNFLTIPATSVSSESTFSTGGRVLDDYRSSLRPAMVEALVCASSWIRGANGALKAPMFVEEEDEDDVENITFPKSVVESN